jgi:hypothetical protein
MVESSHRLHQEIDPGVLSFACRSSIVSAFDSAGGSATGSAGNPANNGVDKQCADSRGGRFFSSITSTLYARSFPFDLEVLAVSFVRNEAFGIGFDLLFERSKDHLAIFGTFSGLFWIKTDNVAFAVEIHFFHFKGRRIPGKNPFRPDFPVPARMGQDFFSDFLDLTHPGSKDIRDLSLFKFLYIITTDHSPISHDAELTRIETGMNPIDHRDQGL